MSVMVVDTNVAIVANGQCDHADWKCQLACVKKLEEVVKQKKIAIDDKGLILKEYSGYLNHSGEPSVGDKFYKHVFNNQYTKKYCVRVSIHPVADSFQEFPKSPDLQDFDKSDRKFVAVALAAGRSVPILNATDSDWVNYKKALVAAGVSVVQLCPHMYANSE